MVLGSFQNFKKFYKIFKKNFFDNKKQKKTIQWTIKIKQWLIIKPIGGFLAPGSVKTWLMKTECQKNCKKLHVLSEICDVKMLKSFHYQ